MLKGIMIQGTSSDSGKSFLVTALCRIFSDMGYKVCPFKAQNMSNNSCATWNGLEIGRAQAVQAEASRLEPEVFMNPVLLKPRRDTSSEIVLMGRVFDAPCDKNYYRDFTMSEGIKAVRTSLTHIAGNFDIVVCEGAGSPAEINLNASEIVNMRVAKEADIPVILVTDVDRGGSLASVVGTLELLGEDRKRVKGIIFNKFRGDISLFRDAVEWTEGYTGIKVIGVMPWLDDVLIGGEDEMSINWNGKHAWNLEKEIVLGIVRFPRISNHTDIEAFMYEPDVRIVEIKPSLSMDGIDGLILPGTKSTVSDMQYLIESGLADKIRSFYAGGGFVFGICGGYQMMGEKIYDPEFRDNEKISQIDGLGLLPVATAFGPEKITKKRAGTVIHPSVDKYIPVKGYEIHFGKTEFINRHETGRFRQLLELDGMPDGAADCTLSCAGTYLHNVFHNDIFRNEWLNRIRSKKGLPSGCPVDTTEIKEESYNKIAAAALKNLDIEYITKNIMDIINRQ